MTRLAILDLVREELDMVEDLMRAKLREAFPPVAQALEGLITRGGKRLRPAITILASKFHACDVQVVLPIAAAAEALHTATLIHDDVIDGALLRRGLPTLNAVWSHGATVLAGDYLFAQAADLAAETENPRVIRIFSRTLMTICDGELRQLFSSLDWRQPKEEYYRRIFAKTASLFQAAAETGAIISGAPEEYVQALSAYGYNFGMAFQIVDDILDFVGDEAVMGKPAGSDLRQGTVTLPVFYFLQEDARAPELERILEHARANGGDRLEEAVALIRDSDAIRLAQEEARDFIARAREALKTLPDVPAREVLADLADFVVERGW
ncbi:MAG TPA: polyprenyl synthetase family protein [Caldilineae bacterium]|nr:polyprenyl synthetase family protein [Caldilineae bacterium]